MIYKTYLKFNIIISNNLLYLYKLKKMTLKEIYDSKENVRESQIPEDWKESFNQFIFGSTCLADFDEDGKVKELVYYSHDFREWYHQNQKEIERDLKINQVISDGTKR